MSMPAWQTGELDEEWVESSPSPPPTLARQPSIEKLPTTTADSIRLKRGSLRALGHSAPRALPPSRHASRTSDPPRIISGHGEGRVLSEKMENDLNAAGRLPSPPTSGGENDAAGTFLVKDGVDDDRGKHLARKGRDMFGPSALEKMFRPPSPVGEPATPSPAPQQQAFSATTAERASASTTPPLPPTTHMRKASHPYAPINPSRLSKSVTPSSASTSFSITLPDAPDITDLPELPQPDVSEQEDLSDARTQTSLIVDLDEGNRSSSEELEHGEREGKERSYEAQNDISPIGKDANYPFTFNAPHRTDLSPQRYDEMSPFNPEGRPDETAHSTIPRQQPQKHGLRLFRGSFDTITREHLSALVDSIAIEDSPSPTRPGRQYSPDEGQRSGSERSRRSGSDDLPSEQDSRSSKRMRMSPVSPARQAPGVRDWGAQGRAMMERIRAMDDSTTSASRSQSDGQVEDRDQEGSGEDELPPSPPYDYRQALPYEYKQPVAFTQPDRPTHRSNPSTTSSGYLRRAEELMARIREMSTTDESSSSPSQTAARTVDSRVPSNVSSDWGMAAARGARQVSDDQQPGPSRRAGLEERRPTSAASSNGQANGQAAGGVNLDDLNRFVSATTVATSTTISTSFVKHAGPRGNGAAAIRVIKPDEVAGVVPDRVGRMRYDKAQMRWVKERDEGLGTVEELVEGSGTASATGGSRNARSRSEESEDVFAGMDSWGRESRVSGRSGSRPTSQEREQDGGGEPAQQAEQVGEDDMDVETESQSSVEDGDDDNGQGAQEADRTHIMRGSDSDSSDSDGDDGVPFDPTQPGREALATVDQERTSPRSPRSPARPPIHHANSAPPVMTPLPGHLSLPRPIRSALRGANSATPAISKKTSWLDHVTPGPGGSGERRSVSFSDGKKSGRMRDLHPDMTNESDVTGVFDAGLREAEGSRRGKAVEVDGEWFRAGTAPGDGERSWMPSARTKRIEGMFDQMGDLSLDAATPSKPPTRACDSLVTSPEALNSATDPDKTIRPSYSPERFADRSSRSFRGMSNRRQDPNATYLTECSFGVAHDKLVQVITDVYGSEPYWEDLREIDLSGKGVESVVKMKEFLPRVEDVRLNDNKVSYLTGMPDTLRTLYVARNRLGSLSSFDHLRGLEVLDLTGNLLESVSHLACLTKLRQLTLDGNNLKSLEGVLQLSGLTHLRARGNKISVVDLTASVLPSLTVLDLGDNRLSRLSGLETLGSLKELVLDGNRLTSLACKRPLMSLRTIKASDNELSSIDLASFPKIRMLYADRNRLSGLARRDGSRSRLENVSLRNQEAGEMRLDWNALSGVKRLYLSGNPLSPSFFPSRPLDSLIYLELAACSLSTWPDLRSIAPMLEILNVNYNFLSTLGGVRGLDRLRKLSCVGAKLGNGSKGIMSGLKGLSALEEVDLRMNPSTLGFYLPLFLPSPSSSPDLSNAHEPSHRAGNPLPNVTLASVRPPDTPGPKDPNSSRRNAAKFSSAPTEVEWKILDSQFRKSLPDEWYSKRLVYRGLIMRSCGALGLLDGVRVEEGERRKAGRLLSAAGEV